MRFFFPGAVVGTIPHADALQAALRLPPGAVDLLEWRVDEFLADATNVDASNVGTAPNAANVVTTSTSPWPGPAAERALGAAEEALSKLPAPLLLTVRHPLEGGAGGLTAAQRLALYTRCLPRAALVDVELRSAGALKGGRGGMKGSMREVIEAARKQSKGVVLSHHDFQATPSLRRLRGLWARARDAGADVFKLAARAETARDFATLLAFLTEFAESGKRKERSGHNGRGGRDESFRAGSAGPALAVMGMGPFGKISRLALGRAGSVLNYGYLGERPQVPGQWPAARLKERLAELA